MDAPLVLDVAALSCAAACALSTIYWRCGEKPRRSALFVGEEADVAPMLPLPKVPDSTRHLLLITLLYANAFLELFSMLPPTSTSIVGCALRAGGIVLLAFACEIERFPALSDMKRGRSLWLVRAVARAVNAFIIAVAGPARTVVATGGSSSIEVITAVSEVVAVLTLGWLAALSVPEVDLVAVPRPPLRSEWLLPKLIYSSWWRYALRFSSIDKRRKEPVGIGDLPPVAPHQLAAHCWEAAAAPRAKRRAKDVAAAVAAASAEASADHADGGGVEIADGGCDGGGRGGGRGGGCSQTMGQTAAKSKAQSKQPPAPRLLPEIFGVAGDEIRIQLAWNTLNMALMYAGLATTNRVIDGVAQHHQHGASMWTPVVVGSGLFIAVAPLLANIAQVWGNNTGQ